VCASESGKPDSDAHTHSPGSFRPRETPQIRPGTSQTGDIAANTRDLTTKPAPEPDNVRVYRFVKT
jgi:hypothetical protein